MALQRNTGPVTVGKMEASQLRHPIKAATLLYRAPGYILRGPIYLVCIIVFSAFLYSFVARKDTLVVAPIKLQRGSVVRQAVGGGMVVSLMVQQNDVVRAGSRLATIQEQLRAAASPEQDALASRIQDLEKELENARDDYDFKVSQKKLDLQNFDQNRETKKSNLDANIQQIDVQLTKLERTLADAKSQLEAAKDEFETSKKLYKNQDITRPQYNASKRKVDGLKLSVSNTQGDIEKTKLSLQQAKQEREQLDSEHTKTQLKADIQKLEENRERDVSRLAEKIEGSKAKLKDINRLVRGVTYDGNMAHYSANHDGVITDIHVKQGQIITAGQPIITLVKASAALEGKILVQNKDIGHLKEGQDVKIKYFAYPYQEYGIQKGIISDIATKPGDDEANQSMYVVKVALNRETISKSGGIEKQLEIGLEGVAEIKTGEKRLVELVFAPLSKFFNNPDDE